MPLSTNDLLQNVLEKKPSEFAGNFSSMVQDRVRDLLAGKRMEVAQSLFGTPPLEMANNVAPEGDEIEGNTTDTTETPPEDEENPEKADVET